MAACARALRMPVPRVHAILATLHVVASARALCLTRLLPTPRTCMLNEPFMQGSVSTLLPARRKARWIFLRKFDDTTRTQEGAVPHRDKPA
eukprot:6241764-Prymnesium_polylepis.2